MICPVCGSEDIVKNGSIHNGKNKYLCNKCGHQFIARNSKCILYDAVSEVQDSILYYLK